MASYQVAPSTEIDLGSLGTVSGTIAKNGVLQFLGVPYAEPISLLNREAAFEPPKPLSMLRPEIKAGTKESDEAYGMHPVPQCLAAQCCCHCGAQCCLTCCWCCCRTTKEDTDGKPPVGLDVLRMNIWVSTTPPPKDTATDGRPVLVWIHGGGDAGNARMGDPNSRDGSKLAEAQGVVVCAIEFRQGAMDWGSGSDVPLNLELRDMVSALQWIQQHIGAFGGDKDCVTVVGESIGGRRVCELLWCPAAQGLFHRAIASSPSAPEAANLSDAHRAHRRRLVLRYLGLPEGSHPTKAELAKLPRMKLCHAQAAAKAGSMVLPMTKLFGASAEDRRLFGAAAQVPLSKVCTRPEYYPPISSLLRRTSELLLLTVAQACAPLQGWLRGPRPRLPRLAHRRRPPLHLRRFGV